MTYNTIFARSFNKHDQKKFGYWAFLTCMIIAFSLCTLFKPDFNHIPSLNLKVSLGVGLKNMIMTEETSKSFQANIGKEEPKLFSNNLESKSKGTPTDEFKQKPKLSQPKLVANVEIPIIMERIQKELPIEEKKQVLNVSDPKPTDIQTNDFNPIQTISNSNIEEIQTGDLKQNPVISDSKPTNIQSEEIKPICNTSMPRTDVCEMKGDIRIDGKSATVYVILPNAGSLPEKNSWRVKPYARKEDLTAMGSVREFNVKMVNSHQETVPQCSHNHSVVGILFSTSGYIGNHFHDFTDTIIPLYLTAKEFNGEVKFLVTNENAWWINKYKQIFQKLSNYEVIDIDKENGVHCFPKMIVGLKQQKEFDIDPSRSRHSMKSFREFLREAYSLKNGKVLKSKNRKGKARIPRLLIVSRKNTRAFLNEGEITNMARNLGFEVIVMEADSNEGMFAKIVNSCDVMMGVHGAGLTNILYLPDKAVFIQILGLGNMEWLARVYFGKPSKNMDLRYLEYQIGINESSLIQQYPPDHAVFTDTQSAAKDWNAYREIYLVKQNFNIDVNRFRGTLQEALKLLHQGITSPTVRLLDDGR